jgi:hypothetical protein
MKTIVDQHGKPFKPNLFSTLSDRLNRLVSIELLDAAKPSEWEAWHRVSQLRKSCGEPPQTITFRRYSPLTEKTP